MRKILSAKFFDRPTLEVARDLLGKFLVRKIAAHAGRGRASPRSKSGRGRIISGMITEVEAYCGPKDRASHASCGKTERTKVMFGEAGYWYVYLIYGMHNCLNIVAERKGFPAAVLVRSVIVPLQHTNKLENVGMLRVSGPGRVCRHFKISRRFNSKAADTKTGLWIENRGVRVRTASIKSGKRIGVDYAGAWKHKLWRFYL